MLNANRAASVTNFTVVILDISQSSKHGIQGLVGSEDGGTGGLPSRLREEKDGMSGLPTDITRRLPEAVGGEGRMWRGRHGGTSGTLVAA